MWLILYLLIVVLSFFLILYFYPYEFQAVKTPWRYECSPVTQQVRLIKIEGELDGDTIFFFFMTYPVYMLYLLGKVFLWLAHIVLLRANRRQHNIKQKIKALEKELLAKQQEIAVAKRELEDFEANAHRIMMEAKQ